jgi:hypothetical protein
LQSSHHHAEFHLIGFRNWKKLEINNTFFNFKIKDNGNSKSISKKIPIIWAHLN